MQGLVDPYYHSSMIKRAMVHGPFFPIIEMKKGLVLSPLCGEGVRVRGMITEISATTQANRASAGRAPDYHTRRSNDKKKRITLLGGQSTSWIDSYNYHDTG